MIHTIWGSKAVENRKSRLLEREQELGAIGDALEQTRDTASGRILLIEGPPGIGKTALMGALEGQAAAGGRRVLKARGSEMERDFGFGIVRQLFGKLLRSLGPDERSLLFSGPAALSAAIFGLSGTAEIDVAAAEGSLYGLFWLVAGLAEREPLVIAVDDAHWGDTASLRFLRYLGQRLDGLPVLVALAARPNEPGVQAEVLSSLAADLNPPTIRPSLLSDSGTAAIVRARLGADAPAIAAACHEATGGNPFLVEELLAELDPDRGSLDSISAERIATMGPERIAASVGERALRLDPLGPEVARAVAVLEDGADLGAVAELVGIDRERAAGIVDGLAAASILTDTPRHRFIHPLLRAAVYERIPAATRALSHARAANLLADHGAGPEEVAAHLLRCEPGSMAGALDVLDAAAGKAAERGAPDSATTYLRRALDEVRDTAQRAALLHRLGKLEVVVRDPASIAHLQEAAELTEDPGRALDISLELADTLAIAGQWEPTVQTVEAGLARFGGTELPGLLDLEALRAAYRGYDPTRVAEYDRDLPRLRALVESRAKDETISLRAILAAIGAIRDTPRATVLELIGPTEQDWSLGRGGRESSLVAQAMFALLLVDAVEQGERIAAAMIEDGRRRGSLLAMLSGVGYAAALDARQGRLSSSEANLQIGLELVEENELSLMALTTFLHFCIETIVERRDLEAVAEMVESLELPPPFDQTQSGGMTHEVRAAVRMMRGDRPGAVADLREAERIFRPLQGGPRFSRWRSRLALALPDASRAEALGLAEEELELARMVGAAPAEGVALRVLGMLSGGDAGSMILRESVSTLRESHAALELARSLAELGAALRRGNQRGEARERLREAADLAQRCGAERLEEQVREELRVAGARPRRRALSGADSLTPGEQRVATAAATGASNREIAQDLFVSLRTVEMHLTNSYRKLGISSRAQLSGTLSSER